MEMNKQRKILLGVLCTGVLGLVADRFLLSPPETASADLIDAGVASEVLSSGAPESALPALPGVGGGRGAIETESGEPVASLPSYASLTQRLVEAQSLQTSQGEQPGESADPFALPESWKPKAQPQAEPNEPNQNTKPDEQFLAAHRLDGTFRSGEQHRAVVDGRAMSVNDELGGYRLIQVNSRWVKWVSIQGERVVVMRASDDLEKTRLNAQQAP